MSMSGDAVAQDTSSTMAAVERPIAPASPTKANTASTWNTKDLGLRLGVDVASAATAGVLTCPLIAIIDR